MSCGHPAEIADGCRLADATCPACQKPLVVNASELLVGPYELVEKLGTGGYGTVWRVRDTRSNDERALKVVSRASLDDHSFSHLVHEVGATRQLRHPNIVTVRDVGQDGQWYYVASDLVRGQNLADWKATRRPSLMDSVTVCRALAEALHFAHEQGIVHRDLKPTNVMVDAEGSPHLIDFGLAKRDTDESWAIERYRRAHFLLRQPKERRRQSTTGPVLGTPAYMSPEQAMGDGHLVDRRTDIYSLGVILYELLVGRRPFRTTNDHTSRRQPPRPSRLNHRIPPALEAICLQAMAKHPEDRFATARELADACGSVLPMLKQIDDLPRASDFTTWLWRCVPSWRSS